MAMKPCYEPINLLVVAENETFRNNFIRDLQGFLQNENYNPPNQTEGHIENTTFRGNFRDFRIISSPILHGNDTETEISSKTYALEDQFMELTHLNAIIFLMRSNPNCYEPLLCFDFFNNVIKIDLVKIEKKIIILFVHNDRVSYENSITADADLWTVLNRIGVDLLHTKTFHFYSRLNKKCYEAFKQFIYMNMKTLWVETVYSHESVVKVIENEDFLDLLLEALFLNEDSIHAKATGKNNPNYLRKWNDYTTVCTNQNCLKFQYCCDCSQVKTKSQLELCDALKNASTCTKCNCPISNHKAVKYCISQYLLYSFFDECPNQTAEQLRNYRHALITLLVTVDLFQKENNKSVCQLYGRLKERVKQKAHYSILETMYKDEMGCGEKIITADDCMRCIWRMLPVLKGFITVEDELKKLLSVPERNLMVK